MEDLPVLQLHQADALMIAAIWIAPDRNLLHSLDAIHMSSHDAMVRVVLGACP
jgi:hypothetical protein